VVVKPPLGVALLASARPALDAHGATTSWAVGGHSLGGVAAATEVGDPRIRGVFFWASYPSRDLSDAAVAAASIFGANDGLSTPADIDASRDRPPPSTAFTEVPGAVHAFFGDYGPQAGDGTPTTDRAVGGPPTARQRGRRSPVQAAPAECAPWRHGGGEYPRGPCCCHRTGGDVPPETEE